MKKTTAESSSNEYNIYIDWHLRDDNAAALFKASESSYFTSNNHVYDNPTFKKRESFKMLKK